MYPGSPADLGSTALQQTQRYKCTSQDHKIIEGALTFDADLSTYHERSTPAKLPILSRTNVDGHAIGPSPSAPAANRPKHLRGEKNLSAALATQAAT